MIKNNLGYFDYSRYKYYDYTLNHLADIFYVLNSSVNFLIYYLMGQAFRNEFLKLMSTTPCLKNLVCCEIPNVSKSKTFYSGSESSKTQFSNTKMGEGKNDFSKSASSSLEKGLDL